MQSFASLGIDVAVGGGGGSGGGGGRIEFGVPAAAAGILMGDFQQQTTGSSFRLEDDAMSLTTSSFFSSLMVAAPKPLASSDVMLQNVNASPDIDNVDIGDDGSSENRVVLVRSLLQQQQQEDYASSHSHSHMMRMRMLQPNAASTHLENWGETAIPDDAIAIASPMTDTSTDVDTEDIRINPSHNEGGNQTAVVVNQQDSSDKSKERTGDQKSLRRLAQNREAARKSRMRKKAYVQQLESSRMKLTQLEQELQRTRQQASSISGGEQSHLGGNGALQFDMEFGRWLEEHQRQINDLRAAVNSHVFDNELRLLVDAFMVHYDELFKIKSVGAKSNVFHMLSGMWKTPVERCFMWLGGFRSSELLKLLARHLEPLTEQQLIGICNLQQSSQQAEDALSQGMEALQQSLADTLASGVLGPPGSSGNVANYMRQMATAMGKLGTLENFLHQADHLRQQTLQQMYRILTTRQAARALLSISDYFSRLRALSSLWLARPKE